MRAGLTKKRRPEAALGETKGDRHGPREPLQTASGRLSDPGFYRINGVAVLSR